MIQCSLPRTSTRSVPSHPDVASTLAVTTTERQQQQEQWQSTSSSPEASVPAISRPPLRAATAPLGTQEMECFYCCPDGGADHQINKCWRFVADLTTQMRVLTSQSRCFCCWKKSFRTSVPHTAKTCKEHNCWCFNCVTEEHLTIFCWRGRGPNFVTIRGERPDKKIKKKRKSTEEEEAEDEEILFILFFVIGFPLVNPLFYV